MSRPTTNLIVPTGRTDRWVYRDYTGDVSPRQARILLAVLAVIVLASEAALRLAPIAYQRTSQNSMQGIRLQMLAMESDPKPKIVAMGDSSLQGGGVARDEDTAIGLLRKATGSDTSVYNLGVPGGNNFTNKLLLDAVERRGVKDIKTIVLETLPTKFAVDKPGIPSDPTAGKNTIDELQRFVPFADMPALNIPYEPMKYGEAIEARLEYGLAKVSYLYRSRDYFRNEVVGGYPAFWIAGKVMPLSLRNRLFAHKSDGQNRLAAKAEDSPYRTDLGKPSDDAIYFSDKGQFDALRDSIRAAKRLSSRPPIVLAHPWHYEYQVVSPRQRDLSIKMVLDMRSALDKLTQAEGAGLVVVPSTVYQDPAWWTRTPAHFNEKLHRVVFESLKPAVESN